MTHCIPILFEESSSSWIQNCDMPGFHPPAPDVLKESASGYIRCSIASEQLAKREVSIVGSIDHDYAYEVCQQLLYLESLDETAEITIYLSTPGGNVDAGLAIYDVMRSIRCPITTVCIGTAASMGAILFVAGDRRLMYPHAEIMIHDPLMIQGPGGSALEVSMQSRRLMKLRKTTCGILAERTGRTMRAITTMTRKDTYLDAHEAIEKGFADEIVAARKEA